MDKNALEILKRPFDPKDIEWRVQQSGVKNGKAWAMVLAYVTNRAIMDRMDEAFGLGGWQNHYVETPSGKGTLCGLSFKSDGEWVTKWDGAEDTAVEATKGGLSGAMKRAGVQLGIGRYLYHLDAGWANVVEKGEGTISGKAKDKSSGKDIWFHWLPPELPSFALPIMPAQIKNIKKMCEDKGSKIEDVLAHYGYVDVKNMTKEVAAEVLVTLSKKKDIN